jgi:hypothetical protein
VIQARYGLVVAVVLFITAIFVSLPSFFRNTVLTDPANCTSSATVQCDYRLEPSWLFQLSSFRTAYHAVWLLLGTLIPLTLLAGASAGLAVVIYRTRARG